MTSINFQLFNRLAKWRLRFPQYTQKEIGQYLGYKSESHFSEILAGKKNLSAEATDTLLNLVKGNGIDTSKKLSSRITLGDKANGAHCTRGLWNLSNSGKVELPQNGSG